MKQVVTAFQEYPLCCATYCDYVIYCNSSQSLRNSVSLSVTSRNMAVIAARVEYHSSNGPFVK